MRYLALHESYRDGEVVPSQPHRATAEKVRRYRRKLRRYRRLLRAAEQARAAAEAANAEKDRVLAAICHDLRTPLNAILGWAEVGRATNDPPRTAVEAFEKIEANARNQARLIDDILDLAKGGIRIRSELVDLNYIVEDALNLVAQSARAKGITLSWEPSALVVFVRGDPMRLQRVVWNLLTNALKFTPRGGQVDVDVCASGRSVVLRVTDTGRGIDREFLPGVFERFAQHNPDDSGHPGGAGLGLAIVQRLVLLHGGNVTAESPGPGQGATFTVTLPRSDAGPSTIGSVAETEMRANTYVLTGGSDSDRTASKVE